MTENPAELQEHRDYLYCPVCKTHVACHRLESGGWEVQCQGCTGECGLCKCYLKRFCFGSREEFPPFEADADVAGPGPKGD